MQKEICTFLCKQSSDESKAGPVKKPQVQTPAGMALVATEQLTAAAKSLLAVAAKFRQADPPVCTSNQVKQQQQQQGAKAPCGQKQSVCGASNYKPASSSGNNLQKNAAGVVIKCDLCKKIGIPLPDSNHIVCYCPNMCQNIQK
eukprot:1059145-Rhodomonas_salina.1